MEVTREEMDLTAAESKDSYEEIRAYVLEKFGLKVSNLYIAQVKREGLLREIAEDTVPYNVTNDDGKGELDENKR